MKVLTKSKYILGLECPKHLWITFNHPEKLKKLSIGQKFIIDQGVDVGKLAQNLFKDGINISTENYTDNLNKTQELLKQKKPLFEAGFQFENCFSRADILEPIENEWNIIEVKSGTDVKDVNIHDLSFQKFVCESSGLKIRKCFLMHLNNKYVKNGEIEIEKLFVKKDVTSEVNKVMVGISERINEIFKIIYSKEVPKSGVLIEKLFNDGPHDCFNENCLELNENHVFCLYRGNKIACDLYEQGIRHIKDIPLHVKLNGKQKIQLDCETKKEVFIDKEKIKEFIDKLKYPIYYLDFETFNNATPMFDGLKPYTQVPFQFSLHIEKEEGKIDHFEYLYNGNSDPRKEFITELIKLIGNKGTVLVYNQTFEIGRLKELAEWYPEFKEKIENILKRIVDLYFPFRDFYYYNSKQEGSASIKDVLPAIIGKDYKGMEIDNGGKASAEFFNMTYGKCTDIEKKKIRENLLKYCEMDTFAEVMIFNKLKELVKLQVIPP